ncbi:hypothetical protein NA57DRAFT_78634 [Rhizodiscina lignyota]|uniref:AMP-dependent synthetase/ligase domain-containing protein n=1 Tax=Rhizodiscina lignyota TaxID=1504668 RepID=A0A9P4I9Z5_9PEZI|nr:hypothetical protein NA57DRAFT_78634 [Rhizodiscina lignyota]
MTGLVEQLDVQLSQLLSAWNIYTTLIALTLFSFIAYCILLPDEPDTHPMLLLRQSAASLVRQPGESAVYRSHEVPHGYPLKTGLNVRPPGAPMYSAGKDGDLRDVWRRVSGEIPLELPGGGGKSEKGKIVTVFGREKVDDVDLRQMGREIGAIGEGIRKAGVKRVAVYLPNSVELLSALFAGAYFGLDIILLPYNQPHDAVCEQLKSTNAECLIAEAGALPLENITKACASLKQAIWVVEETSRHMDWTEVPEDVGGKIDVAVWHELVKDASNGNSSELPARGTPGDVITLSWQENTKSFEIVTFTQANLISAIGALITALPPAQRFTPSDLFLPADALTNSYTLCLTLAALFCHATLALNSVAGPVVDITDAAKSIAPTIIVASATAGATLQSNHAKGATGVMTKMAHFSATKALQAGRMPVDNALTRINAPSKAALGTTPGKLRVLFLSEKTGGAEKPLSENALSDLRVLTGARVVYALTTPKVAGAVAQTNIYDYRTGLGKDGDRYGHFGAVLSSVEVKLVDKGNRKTTDENYEGEIVVSGPAVSGGEARLGIAGTFRDDNTLAYSCDSSGKPDL